MAVVSQGSRTVCANVHCCFWTKYLSINNFPCVFCRDFKQHSRGNPQFSDDQVSSKNKSAYASQGLAEACKFVYNDAKFVNERAQNDILLLSRYSSTRN